MDQLALLRGNESNLEDIILLLEELFKLHKELNTEFNLKTNYLTILRKNLSIELKDPLSCCYLLVYKENKPIGFCVGKKIFSPYMFAEPCKGYIPYIYIKDTFRRKGIGKQLMMKLEDWFKENEINIIEVNVMVENEKAFEFYNKERFSTVSKRLRKQIGD